MASVFYIPLMLIAVLVCGLIAEFLDMFIW